MNGENSYKKTAKKSIKKPAKKISKRPKKNVSKKSEKKMYTKKSIKKSTIKKNNIRSNIINLDNVNISSLCELAEKIYKKNISSSIKPQEKNKIIDDAKKYILKLCNGSDEYSIFFTSGEEESNRIFLCSAVNAYKKIRKIKPHVVISSVEGASILKYAISLRDSDQLDLTFIRPNIYGCILSEHVKQSLKPNTCCVLITYIDQELGSVNNIEKISSILHENKIPLHSDCSYLFGKHKLDLSKSNLDSATISFNKINGPLGIGAIIIKKDLINGYKLYEHSMTFDNKNVENIPAIISSIESVKFSLLNRKIKNTKLLNFRNDIINRLGDNNEVILYSDYINSDESPLDSKNKIIILGPPISNESYYTPCILSILIKSNSKITAKDIQKELEKKDIIIGIPDIDAIKIYDEIKMNKEDQSCIIRISLSDDITQQNINTFISEIKKIIN